MAQQLINTGTTANDGTGSTWKAGGDIINDNFTELYASNNSNILPISVEADFPNQDASSIYLDSGIIYQPIASFSTAKTIVFQGGRISGLGKGLGVTLIYTGSGNQFSATDNDMNIEEVTVNAAAGSHYSFTTSGANAVALRSMTSSGALNQGTITNGTSINIDRYTMSASTSTTGFIFAGTSGVIVVQTSNTIGAPSGFISFDLGSATFIGINFTQFFQDTTIFGNNAASVAVSGLASSGNVTSGNLISVDTCNFSGLTAAFTNISPSDIRWEFMSSPPFENSSKEADSYLTASSTVTIGTQSVFVAINGSSWASDITERFSSTTAGVLTFLGERDAKFFVSMTSTIEKVGGGADEIEARISLNGVTSGASFDKTGSTTENASPTSVTSQRLVTLSNGDTIQGYVANNGSTSNIEVSKANLTIIEVR